MTFSSNVKQAILDHTAYVNNAQICSMNQPVFSKEGQANNREPLMSSIH